MDIFMPDMSGDEAALAIREKAGDLWVYIIAQSAGGSEDRRQKLLEGTVDDYLAKPIVFNQFHKAMRLGIRAANRNLPSF